MKIEMKKIVSGFLAIILVACAFSVLAIAESEKTYELSIPANSGTVEVKVNGAVKHNGGESCIINVPEGADVTLTATAKTGEFMFWTDENRNTCSENASYSFKMIGPKEVRAWFGAANGTMILYRNDNTTKQVLGSATCISPDHFNSHLASSAYKFGSNFAGWSLTVEQIKAKISAGEKLVVVSPTYTTANLTAKVNVVGGTIVGQSSSSVDVAVMTSITLKADNAPDGKKFIGWAIADGTYISENQVLNVVVAADETYTAVFVDTSSTETCVPGVSLKITNDADGTIRLWSPHFVPDSCTVVSYGFIYLKNGSVAEQYMILELAESRNLSVAEYTRTDKSGMLTCTANASSICARAFMVYTDASGNTQTIYSSAITK